METEKENLNVHENSDSATPSITMDTLTEQENFPEPQQHAIDAFAAKEKAESAVEAPVKLKKDGTPAKRRGRKPKSEIVDPRRPKDAPQMPDDGTVKVDSTQAAQLVSGMLENMQVTLISKEFIYSDLEREANINAWRDTFDHYGGVSITPPQALALSHMSIILARAAPAKSETRTKLQLAKIWFTHKIAGIKFKLKPQAQLDPEIEKPDEENAHVNHRPDAIR